MNFEEYQMQARQARKDNLPMWAMREHSLFGLASETGKVLGFHQKVHEGLTLDEDALRLSCGDILRMISELCDNYGWQMEDIAFNSLLEARKKTPKIPGQEARHYAKGEGRRKRSSYYSKQKGDYLR